MEVIKGDESYSVEPDEALSDIHKKLYKNLTEQQRKVFDEILMLLFEREEENVVFSRAELGLLESLYFNKWNINKPDDTKTGSKS